MAPDPGSGSATLLQTIMTHLYRKESGEAKDGVLSELWKDGLDVDRLVLLRQHARQRRVHRRLELLRRRRFAWRLLQTIKDNIRQDFLFSSQSVQYKTDL